MLTDYNSDFGINNAPLIVTNIEAVGNLIKNVLRTPVGADRYEYIDMGLELENTLKEPSTAIGAKTVFMFIEQCLRYNLPNIQLDTRRTKVTPNFSTGEYDVLIVLTTGEDITFSI